MRLPIYVGMIYDLAKGKENLGLVKASLYVVRPGSYDLSGKYTCMDVWVDKEVPVIRHHKNNKICVVLNRDIASRLYLVTVKENISVPSAIWDEIVAMAVVVCL